MYTHIPPQQQQHSNIPSKKTMSVLDEFCDCYLRLLDAMDNKDGTTLENILFVEMAPETNFVRHLLHLIALTKGADGGAAAAPRLGVCPCAASASKERKRNIKKERDRERSSDESHTHTRIGNASKKPFLIYMVGARSVISCCFLFLVLVPRAGFGSF
jgi:hypothetical protein